MNAHAQQGVSCLDCHEPTIKEQVQEVIVQVGGKAEVPLTMRTFPNEFCFRCHEHGTIEQIIERTQDYVIAGEVINPHDAHAGIDDSGAGAFECSNCHKAHRRSPTVQYCYGCHHDRTFYGGCGDSECHSG